MDSDLIKKIRKQRWIFYVNRKFNWFVEYTQIQANRHDIQARYLGFANPVKNYLILNGEEYSSEQEFPDYFSFFDRHFTKDVNFFAKFAENLLKLSERTRRFTRKLKGMNLEILSDQKLEDLLQKFSNEYTISFLAASTRPDDFLDLKLKEFIKKRIPRLDSAVEEIFSKIATYSKTKGLVYVEEPLALLKIAREIKKKRCDINNFPRELQEKIEKHIEKYAWLKGPVLYDEIAFSKEEYLKRIRLLIQKNIDYEIGKITKSRAKSKGDFNLLVYKHRIKGKFMKLCEAVRDFIYLRTYTTEVSDYLFYVGRKTLLKELAERLSVKKEDITMLEPGEILLYLREKKVLRDLIEQRKQEFAILWIDGELTTLFGPVVSDLQSEILQNQTPEVKYFRLNHVIKGMVASKGSIRGKVKVLSSYKDTDKVKKGEILVASMTTPDYILAMEKAAAFVTDEGGITCHAAIIAREFGVPCIVGTKIATKVLKDGDFVEVDGKSGIIKKIS